MIFYSFVKFVLHAKNFCSLDALDKQIPQNLVIHGNAHRVTALFAAWKNKGVFRGDGRAGNKIALVFYHEIQEKQCRFPHNRKGFFQEVFIQRISVVGPLMGTQPGGAHDPVSARNPQILRCGIAPDIGIMVGNKATAAIHGFRSFPSVFHHAVNVV